MKEYGREKKSWVPFKTYWIQEAFNTLKRNANSGVGWTILELIDKVWAEDSSFWTFCLLLAIENRDMDEIAKERGLGKKGSGPWNEL